MNHGRWTAIMSTAALVAWGTVGTLPAADTGGQDVIDAFADGGSFTLATDVTVSDALTLASGTSLSLDLEGHTLTVLAPAGETGVTNGGTLSISGGVLAITGGRGTDGVDGADGTVAPAHNGTDGSNGGNGQPGLHNLAAAALTVSASATLRVSGGNGGKGGEGGDGGNGDDGGDGHPFGGNGGRGGNGGDGGFGGTGLVNDGAILAAKNGSITATGGDGGNAGSGGDGGDGGDALFSSEGPATAGGNGGDGGDSGDGGTSGVTIRNDGTIVASPATITTTPGAGGTSPIGGDGGNGGTGGLADVDTPSTLSAPSDPTEAHRVGGTDGADGTDRGAAWAGRATGKTTLDGHDSDAPPIFDAWSAHIGDALDLLADHDWPARDGYTLGGWWDDTGHAADPTRDYAGHTLTAQWTKICHGPKDASELADAFSSATGETSITVCADITSASTDGALNVPAGTSLTLDLNGYQLTATGASPYAGIGVGPTATLVVDDTADGGSLTAVGGEYGAGIGGAYNTSPPLSGPDAGTIRIESGTVHATGGSDAAGIGGAYSGGAGTVTINGGHVTAVGSACADVFCSRNGAGIGGGNNGKSGVITINGGTVDASGEGVSAAIGGGGASGGENGGLITITGGTVTATAHRGPGSAPGGGAGIGGSAARAAGPVVISGGTVTATGVDGGAGIGGGGGGCSAIGSLEISGGAVRATGGDLGGAGIGGHTGSFCGPATPMTIDGGSVTATGHGGGAGIGGSRGASGANVAIAKGATVGVSATDGAPAIGRGVGGDEFGDLTNAGSLTVASGSTMTIPAGTTVTNTGTITADGGIVNNGTIDGVGSISPVDNVTVHNYLLHFVANDASGTMPDDLRVFAATLADAGHAVPPGPGGAAFTGWTPAASGTGTPLDADTDLTGTGDGPRTLSWYAQQTAPAWVSSSTATFDVGQEATTTFDVDAAETVSQMAGTLPGGLSADVSPTGVTISGSPESGTAGTYSLEFAASNTHGATVSTVTVTVNAALSVTTSDLPEGTVGSPYEARLAAAGGDGSAYTWTISEGRLPDGLALSDDGQITGTPTAEGDFAFTVSVNDPARAELTISITAADMTPTATPEPTASVTPLPSATSSATTPPGRSSSGPGQDSSDQRASALPTTGADSTGPALLGVVLLLAGFALTLVARRRRRTR